jgi:cytochrome bd-type quinol oxidase subunit 2
MRAALRTLAAILAGMFVAFILVVAVEFFGAVVHPLPEHFQGTMEEMCRHVERFPTWVLAVVVPAWGVAAFAGAWTARRNGNLWSFAIVGLLLLAALVLNISKLPYPMWFKIVNLLVIPGAIVLGGRLAIRRKTAGMGEAK